MPFFGTYIYKTTPTGHPIHLDIYHNYEQTSSPKDIPPIFLFFHSGGLTSYNRRVIFPHMVQACLSRNWVLASADYRLLPQVSGTEIWEDVKDAYKYVVDEVPIILNFPRGARGKEDSREAKRIIVGGSSAGGFLAILAASRSRELTPAPKAILSIYGVTSFKNSFFSSSIVIGGATLITKERVSHLLSDTVIATGERDYPDIFYTFDLSCLKRDLSRNTAYKKPEFVENSEVLGRASLYDYFVQENRYPELIGDVERELDANEGPKIIMLHGDADIDVPIELSQDLVKKVGDRARLVVVKGAGHAFDDGLFLEDKEKLGAKEIHETWGLLDEIIANDGEFGK
ncbi:hypothetical protein B7494_g7429 [Chlorociboria aeruginascens]|nr:hypothetical protein B7494_g7429 [Chlorociboria aeruginascens]